MSGFTHHAPSTAVPAPPYNSHFPPPPPPPPPPPSSHYPGPGAGGYQQPVAYNAYTNGAYGGQYGGAAAHQIYPPQHSAGLAWTPPAPVYPQAQQYGRPPMPPAPASNAYTASFPAVPAYSGSFTLNPPQSNFNLAPAGPPHVNGSYNRSNGHGNFNDRHQRGRRDGHNQGRGGRGNFNQNGKRGRDHHGRSGSDVDHRSFKKANIEKPAVTASSLLPASLPPKPPKSAGQPSSRLANKPKKKQRNVLGLTPKAEDVPSSEDEADEEAVLASVYSDGAGVSENGVNLKTSEDIQKWIAERRRRYPTKANIAAKMTLLSMGEQSRSNGQAKASASAQLVANYDSSEAEDEDQKPEEISSKTQVLSLEEQASAGASDVTRTAIKAPKELSKPAPTPGKVYCKTWANLGFCTWKKCKFLHSLPGVSDTQANEEHANKQQSKHRRNLYQEFVKQEELEKQNTALQAIKMLGAAGLLSL